MHIRGDVRDRIHVFRLDGAITMVEIARLKSRVRAAIEGGAAEVVLDLAEVDFVDSTGLGAFVALHKAAIEVGCGLRLRSPRPHILALFELTRLHRVLCIDSPAGPVAT